MIKLNIPDFPDGPIMFVGVGGGFDVFGAIPLATRLPNAEHVFVSYGDKKDIMVGKPREGGWGDYPSNQLGSLNSYVLGRHGVQNVKQGLQTVLEQHPQIQTIFAIDGGVDSLMRGHERNSGTILEDFIVMAAIDELAVEHKYLGCIGLGTEAAEGIDTDVVLSYFAELSDHLVGTCSLSPKMDEYQVYKKCCEEAWANGRKSHIHSQVIAAVEGGFGFQEIEHDARLHGTPVSEISISPLMGMYWIFEFDGVVAKNPLINAIKPSATFTDALLLLRNSR